MVFEGKNITLKDGRTALLCSPKETEAAEILAFITRASGETEFLLRYPEEFADFTPEREAAFLRDLNASPDQVMICCLVDGRVAGNCQLTFKTGMKERHRATVAIGILEEFWNRGIGTALFREMIELARSRGVRQLELDFLEGNSRARALYEKMGFRITGVKPDAIRLRDGRLLNEYMMMKLL